MSKVVKVLYKPVSSIPDEIREANNIPSRGYVELKWTNSQPSFTITPIGLPGSRVKDVLKEEGIKFNL
ncbi:MAG: hypothetical protein V1875_00255 [Candidatus Altiarchaeota archaeon]